LASERGACLPEAGRSYIRRQDSPPVEDTMRNTLTNPWRSRCSRPPLKPYRSSAVSTNVTIALK
jgi:hypothetical protein